jgi:hypothetical protein
MEGRYAMTATQDFRALSAHRLPERPHLDHLRHEAKRRHAAMKAVSHNARLSDAQFLLAREYGFQSWPALKAEVERRRQLCGATETLALPPLPLRRPRREGIAALASPTTAELALFPAAVAGFALTQLASISASAVALLHLLLR